jgi:hypothetical protein
MGTVVVKTKLIILADDGMARRRKLSRSKVRSAEVAAVANSVAVTLTWPASLARQLGLVQMGFEFVQCADGKREQVSIVEGVVVEIEGRRTISRALVWGDEVLIGKPVRHEMDYAVDYGKQRLMPRHAEGRVTMVRQTHTGTTLVYST